MGMYRELFLASGRPQTAFGAFQFALEVVRKRHPLMTVGTLSTFFYIVERARLGPLTATDVADELELSTTTVFRQCDQLAEGVNGKNGMNLIKKVPHPEDARARVLALSFKGLQLSTDLKDLFTPLLEEQ